MTRAAAEVQAEIDALEAVDSARVKLAVDTSTGIDEALALHLETLARTEPLKAEHARLTREELDAVTPAATRKRASLLRSVFYLNGGTVMGGADRAWDALDTKEAAAWAAVAREAGRG